MSGDFRADPSPKSQAYVAGVNVSVTSTGTQVLLLVVFRVGVSEVVQERNGLSAHGPAPVRSDVDGVEECPGQVHVQAGREDLVGVAAEPEPCRQASQRRSGVGLEDPRPAPGCLPDALGRLLRDHAPVATSGVGVAPAESSAASGRSLGWQQEQELTGMAPGAVGVVGEDHDGSELGVVGRLGLEAGRGREP